MRDHQDYLAGKGAEVEVLAENLVFVDLKAVKTTLFLQNRLCFTDVCWT